MTRYTDHEGRQSLLCDHCRQDMPIGSSAYSLNAGTVNDGYVARDYDKGEMVICPACATQITRLAGLLADIGLWGNMARYFGIASASRTQEVFV